MLSISRIIFTAAIILIFSALPSYSQSPTALMTESAAAADSCAGFKVSHTPTFSLQGYGISKIKTFDVNHDGINDLILNLTSVNKIAVQFGDGEGGISETRYFAAGDNPTDFDIGDFNRDGEIDILVANTSANKFSLLLGDGAGNFSLYASYDSAYSPQALKVGYFDSDNYLDVAVGTSNALQIFKGSRDLTFSLVSTGSPVYSPNKIISGDFNKDGKTDLVVTYAGNNSSAEIRLLLGKGDDTFDLTTTISGVQAYAVVSADVNKDGNLDLIASDYTSSKILTYQGNGDGSFKEPIISDTGYFYGLETIDFNGDGKLDLVTGSGSIFIGDDSGKFSFYAGGSGNNYAGIAVGDFNSDDVPDFAVVAGSGSGTSIILNSSKFEPGPVVYVNRPYEVDSADFNGDGRNDLVTVSAYNNSAHVLLQDANGNFVDTSGYFGLPVGGGYNVSPFSVTVGDFNNDRKPDFAVPDAFAGKVAVFTGNGDGTFVRTVFSLSSTNARPYYIRTGDFNNDGFLDIITTNLSSRDYSVLLNDGAGGFTLLPGVNINPDSVLSIVTIGDITNDGILDLIVARQSLGDFIYLVGKGDGTFVRQPTLQNGVGAASSFILSDLNNDGNLDLVIGGSGRMQVSFGVGNGGFFDAVSYPVDGQVNDLEFQDFDSDGIKDIVAAAGQTNSLLFFKGKGNGVFNQAAIINIDSPAQSLTSKDFNNDGKPDLGVLALNGRISVVYNETNNLPCLSVGDIRVNEGNSGTTDAGFTVTLSAAAAQDVSVDYKTVSRTAASGTDFVPRSGTLVFPAGRTSQTVSTAVNGDALAENDETFTLTLSNPRGAALSDAVGVATIIDDDDAVPNLSIGDATVVEGSGGLTTAYLPLTLSGASGKRIKVQAVTKDITAAAVEDYQPLSETIYFEPGEVSKNLPIEINPDYRVENDETFEVNLTNPLNVGLAVSKATVTIKDDDVGGTIQFTDAAVSVAESGGSVRITVSRTNGNAAGVGFMISTKDGTASEFKDYAPIRGVLTFGANENSKTIVIPIINDTLNEDTETFSLNLENVTGGGTLGAQKSVTVSIEDDDNLLPGLSISDVSVAEGNYGVKSLNYRISLLAASGRKVTLSYTTQNGTATAPEDYIAASGTVEFAPEETSKTVQLSIVGDTRREPDEVFSLILSNPSNAVIARGTGTITILNDDPETARRPVMDFDGDGRSDVSVYRPSNGFWYINQSQSGFAAAQFGDGNDKIVPADYDGDGKTDIAVYRRGTWYLQRSTAGFTAIGFGTEEDIPQPADFDGDGKADLAVFRPSDGIWYVYNLAAGQFTAAQFGNSTDKPVVADYNGDGKADYAVFRPSNATWYIARSGGIPSRNFDSVRFGNSTDMLVPADYDGDGKADVAVYRPFNGTWYRLNSANGQFIITKFGISTDVPSPGDFDGDGRADVGVFRDGIWYIQQSTDGFTAIQFGTASDKPVPNAFVP